MAWKFVNVTSTTFPCIPTEQFEIEAGYPRTSGGGSTPLEGVLKGWINYDDYNSLIELLQPSSTLVGGLMTVQSYGMKMPGGNDFDYLRCVRWEATPVYKTSDELDGAGYHKSDLWYFTIIFQSVTLLPTVHRRSVGGQVLSLDNQGLMWDDIRRKRLTGGKDLFLVDTATPLEESDTSKRSRVGVKALQDDRINAHLLIAHTQYEISWQRVVSVPVTAIMNTIGRVNSQPLRFRDWLIPPECCLMTGANIQESVMLNRQVCSEVVYHFAIRIVKAQDQNDPGGWNHFFRSVAPEQRFLTVDNSTGDKQLPFTFSIGIPASAYNYAFNGSEGYQHTAESHKTNPNQFYACTGLPGFYRLEMTPGDPTLPCIEVITGTGGLPISMALETGYLDQLAIFNKVDFSKIFQPEPPPSIGIFLDPLIFDPDAALTAMP
jgi:hypothetical protein